MDRDSFRILLAEASSFSKAGIVALQEIGATDGLDLTQEELADRVPGYHVLVVRLGLRITEEVLARGEMLRAVATPTTGLDHIDVEAAQSRGIAVLSLKGEREFLDQVYATAEHTFALLFSLIRRIPAAFEAAKGYVWRRDLYRGYELSGKTIGLIGCGRLGTMVTRYAQAFGMNVLVYDPYAPVLPKGVKRCTRLADVLEASDILSLHVPLNDETRGMLSTEEFSYMPEGVFLVNTSRGAIVDEAALLDALYSGRVAGAALDVLTDEHKIERDGDHPLIEYARAHDNLIITPHIGGATYESVEKADLFIADKIRHLCTLDKRV